MVTQQGEGQWLQRLRRIGYQGTIEDCLAHIRLCNDIMKDTGLRFDPRDSRLLGKSREEIIAKMTASQQRSKRRAGVKALQAKYGDEIAESIVRRHSGRTPQRG